MDTEIVKPELEFTTDWLGDKAVFIEQHLAYLKGVPNAKGLEIGSFEGRSAIWFCDKILTGLGAKLTCIDPWVPTAELMAMGFDWSEAEKLFDRNVANSGHAEKINKIKAPSFNALRGLNFESYDFIYIDGSHRSDHVMEDAVLSFRLIKNEGVMIFDDYKLIRYPDKGMDPQSGIDKFYGAYRHNFRLLHVGEQAIVRKETKNYSVGGFTTATPDAFLINPNGAAGG